MDKLDTILACLPESPYKATFTEEIESLRQQLLAALAVCEEKDEWLRFLSTVENIDDVEKALAIQPDASALKAHDDALIERCATVCDKNHSTEYCAAAIRELKGTVDVPRS